MAFTNDNDLNILQVSDSLNVGAGAGDDKYILSSNALALGQIINITDAQGTNRLQLIGGLTIVSSMVSANSIQLTLNNGSIVNVFGADTFFYEAGGNPLSGAAGIIKTFASFVTTVLGVATVPTGTAVTAGKSDLGVNADGSTTASNAVQPVFSITADTATVNEGNNATFTITLSSAQSAATTVNYTLVGTGGTVLGGDTGTVNVSGGIVSGSSITFPAGVTTANMTVPIFQDNAVETGKGISVTLSSPSAGSALGTATANVLTPDDPASNLSLKAALFSNIQSGTGIIAKLTDAYLNTLDSGFYWSKTNISYDFNNVIPSEYLSDASLIANWNAFNTLEKNVAQAALQRVSDLTPLVFSQVSGTAGDIRFNTVDMSNASGFAYLPDGRPIGGDVWINNSNRTETDAYQPGSYGQLTILHEIGHALGLKHTFDTPYVLPTDLDNLVHSVMSYTDYKYLTPSFTYDSTKVYYQSNRVYQTEYSLFDVEALQAIYGANTSYHTGADTYAVSANQYHTIWDAGGTDTIDESTATGACTVNLCPGQYSSLNVQTLAQQQAATLAYYHAAGITGTSIDNWVASIYSGSNAVNFYTGENNLAIAAGVWIENVNTGAANDVVIDNAVNNNINAGVGDDLIQLYWGGFDTVYGGNGTDTVQVLDKQAQDSMVKQADGSYLIVGTYFAAVLIGVEQIQFSDVFQTLTA